MSVNQQEINYNEKIKESQIQFQDDINDYKMDKKIGEGRFSKVYLAKHKLTSENVAIKIIFKNASTTKEILSHTKAEIEILKKLKHNNICKLYSVIETNERIYIIQEFVDGEDLSFFIHQNQKFEKKIKIICNYFRQLISALDYLHEIGISHRDLKPENILINEKNEIKLVDFGLGKIYRYNGNKQLLRTRCGSPFYCSPEMILGKKYDGNLSDIWSLGIILYFMIFNELPFYDNDFDRLSKKIIEGKYNIPRDKKDLVGKDVIDLIHKILKTEPKKRIKIKEIMNHKWFNMENNVLYIGININELVIPIDEDIVKEIHNKYGYDIKSIIETILRNEFNKIKSLYLILLKIKIKNGEKSVSDLMSDLFLDYIKDENNKIKMFNNNIENAIKQRLESIKIVNTLEIHEERKDNYINDNKESIIDIQPELDNKEKPNKNEIDKEKSPINKNLKKSHKKCVSIKLYDKDSKNKTKKLLNIEIPEPKLNEKRTKPIKIYQKTNPNELKKSIQTKSKQLKKNKTSTNNKLSNKTNSQKNIKVTYTMNKDEQKTNYTVKTTPNKIISKFNYEQKTNYTLKNTPNKIISKFNSNSLKKEKKFIKIKKEIVKRSCTNEKNKSIDISEYSHKNKIFLSLLNNNSLNRDNSYINKTINGNLSKHQKQKIKDLLIRKSYNNNIKNIKKNILKINEETLKKDNFKKHKNVTHFNTRTNFRNNNNYNKNIKNKIIHVNNQKEKNIKLTTSKNNFYNPKLKLEKNWNNHSKIKSTKNFEHKIINTTNNSKNKTKHFILAPETFKKTEHNKSNKSIKKLFSNIKIEEKKNSKNIVKVKKQNLDTIKTKNSNNKNLINSFEKPFDLNFIYLFKDKGDSKTFIERDLKNKKIKFNKIDNKDSEEIIYICSKQTGLKFNVNVNMYKKENLLENCYLYIYKIKNISTNYKYEFSNFIKSFYSFYKKSI